MVADVSLQSAIDSQSQTAQAQSSLAQNFTEFLTLLTTQLQNQDPMNPQDSTEFTNQLVAFTGVEQQINGNQKLDSLVALGLSQSSSSAQSYVGQTINYVSSEFYFDGQPETLRYSLPQAANSATMRIYNEDGGLVYEQVVPKSAGAHDVTWNGQLNGGGIARDGTYEIVIDALDEAGDPVNATTVVSGEVKGVESQNGTIFLLVGERAVALSNVLNSEKTSEGTISDSVTSALNYVGLDVGYNSDEFILTPGETIPLEYNLDRDADRAKIHIYDDLGNKVFTADTGTNEGVNVFDFHSTDLPAGQYRYEIDAIAKSDDEIKNQRVSFTGGDMDIDYTLQETYDRVEVEIVNNLGQTIAQESLNRNMGAHKFTWDGKMDNGQPAPSGQYNVKITAIGTTDEKISYSSSTAGRVTGVEVDNGVVFLQIGNTKTVPLSDILSVSTPVQTQTAGGSA